MPAYYNEIDASYAAQWHCRIGRIHFKNHRGRESRKDKMSIRSALEATTAKLSDELGMPIVASLAHSAGKGAA